MLVDCFVLHLGGALDCGVDDVPLLCGALDGGVDGVPLLCGALDCGVYGEEYNRKEKTIEHAEYRCATVLRIVLGT